MFRFVAMFVVFLALPGCAIFEPTRPALPSDAVPAIDAVTAANQNDERLRMWRADIDVFEELLLSRHAGLFAVLTEERFNDEFAALREELPQLRDDQIVVLIGPGTFSSAGLNTEEFQTRTKATIVGEPTGQRPDSWFECRWDWLPNSLLRVNYMIFPPSFAPGKPDAYEPDILVPVTCDDWLSGRDRAYERALELAPAT